MWIKICGITSKEAAGYCLDTGADAIGFVFAESKRQVSVPRVKEIIEYFPPGTEKVGVFVNAPLNEVSQISNYLGLDILQFHGNETPQYCNLFQQRVIKSVVISNAQDFQRIGLYRDVAWAVILDSFSAGKSGGTGETWDWQLYRKNMVNPWSETKIIAAGGLTAGNVLAVIEEIAPYGVDISSGVENKGQKDYSLIKQFVNQVRGCEKSEST